MTLSAAAAEDEMVPFGGFKKASNLKDPEDIFNAQNTWIHMKLISRPDPIRVFRAEGVTVSQKAPLQKRTDKNTRTKKNRQKRTDKKRTNKKMHRQKDTGQKMHQQINT